MSDYANRGTEDSYAEMQEQNGVEGGTIATYTGKTITPLDPDPNDINILDIAHALALTCRYNGHCKYFYSVAEHSVYVSRIVPEEYQLTALLHDASEAYVSDVARPIKDMFGDFENVEKRLQKAISERFPIEYPFPDEVHEADDALFGAEAQQIMQSDIFVLPDNIADIEIECWDPEHAEFRFIQRYQELTGVDLSYIFAGG